MLKHLSDPRKLAAWPFLLIPLVWSACSAPPDSQTGQQAAGTGSLETEQQYLGQTPPGDTPVLFAPGTVNTEAVELNSYFTPDGREFFFSRLIAGPDDQQIFPGKTRPILYRMVFQDGTWGEATPLRLFPDAPDSWAADMVISPDGQLLYFTGQQPVDGDGGPSDLNLWVSHRVDGGWSMAEPLPGPVNSQANEIYSSVVADGSLYFTADRSGGLAVGGTDLYRAQRQADGSFAEPVNLGAPINSSHGVGDTFVAPDESYLIMAAGLPGSHGDGDLYVSFRQADGRWGVPINLGPEINSADLEYCPMVTQDGKYLFFSRRRSDPVESGWPGVVQGDVYWVAASVIERLRE